MLALLLNTPHNRDEWDRWALSNGDAVRQIQEAVLAKKNIRMTEYQLFPINFDDFSSFLNNNQTAHNDIAAAVGTLSSDVLSVDIKKPQELSAWIWLNYQDLFQACQVLGIGP